MTNKKHNRTHIFLSCLQSLCKCDNTDCPPFVTPAWLTEAAGQSICSLEEPQGFNCYAGCKGVDADAPVSWFARPCAQPPVTSGQIECDKPILAFRKAARAAAAAGGGGNGAAAAPAAAPVAAPVDVPAPPPPAPVAVDLPAPVAAPPAAAAVAAEAEAEAENPLEPSSIDGVPLPYKPEDYIDFRGLTCELRAGVETCFVEDEQGREVCPPSVTPAYLSNPADQWLCSPENAKKYYCTVGCQDGNPEVRWGAHEVAWCNGPGAGSCPKRVRRSRSVCTRARTRALSLPRLHC